MLRQPPARERALGPGNEVVLEAFPKMAAESGMDVDNDFEKYGEDISLAKDGGVRKIIKQEGDGRDGPPIGSKAQVYYSGRFLDGQEFDSNVGKKDPFEFEVGKGNLV